MRMNQYQSELATMDQEWMGIQVEDRSKQTYDPLPDGKYQVKVDSVAIEESKNSGRLQLKWVLKVIAGAFTGRLIWRYNGFDSTENLTYLKKDLTTCGVTVTRLSELEDNLQFLLDTVLEVQLKSKTGHDGQLRQNCYINKEIQVPDDGLADVEIDNKPF
jgi:hypothetical protein